MIDILASMCGVDLPPAQRDMLYKVEALEHFFKYVLECEGSDEKPRVSKYIERLESQIRQNEKWNFHEINKVWEKHLEVINELIERINKEGL